MCVCVCVCARALAAFFSLARIFGECSTIRSSPALLLLFFFKVKISSCTLIPLFMPESVHSGSASLGDCGRMFPDKLHVSSILDMVPHHGPGQGYSQPTPTSLGQGRVRV